MKLVTAVCLASMAIEAIALCTHHLLISMQHLAVVDCFTLELTADTKLLLCSDGLSDMVDDRQISEILQAHQTAEAAEVLLEAALDNGGRDNISLILIDLTPTEEDNRS